MSDFRPVSTRRGIFLTLIGVTVMSALTAAMAPNDVTVGFTTNLAASLALFWAVDQTLAEADQRRSTPARLEAQARAIMVLGTIEEVVKTAYLSAIMCGHGNREQFNSWPRDRLSEELAPVLANADVTMKAFDSPPQPLGGQLVLLLLMARRRIADADQTISHQDPAVIAQIGAFSRCGILSHVEALHAGVWPLTTFFEDEWLTLIRIHNDLQDALNSTREDGRLSSPSTFYVAMSQKGLHAEKAITRQPRTKKP